MSGDLRNPSKSIPSGTLNGLLVTFIAYALVIISMGATIGRETLYTNLNVIQDVCSPRLGIGRLQNYRVTVPDQYFTAFDFDGRIRDVVLLRSHGCHRVRKVFAGAGPR